MDLAGALNTVVAAFAAVPGIETAGTDASQITAPGVLVQFIQADRLTMGGWEVQTRGVLVVSDTDGGPGPAGQLGALLGACVTAGISPDGPVVGQSILLPSNPAPLPGLLIPITVRTDA